MRIGWTAAAVLALMSLCNGCGLSPGSAQDAQLTEREQQAALVAADTLRTYAVAARCAMLAYMDPSAPDSLDRVMMESLSADGVRPADPTASRLTAHTASTPGFKASIYYDEPAMRYIIAYAGTEPESADIITDINGAFSIDEPQNTAALSLLDSLIAHVSTTQSISDDAARRHILLAGHSLGGRLASVGAIMGEVDAVAFNPANIPIDLQKRMAEDESLVQAADVHLTRIHSKADELTGGLQLAERLSALLPYIDKAMDMGSSWLDDRSSLGLLKGIISGTPEIAGVVDMVWNAVSPSSDSRSAEPSRADITRIIVQLVKQMRSYNVTVDDLRDPLFYQYRGQEVSLPYATGGHSIAPLATSIDSAYHAK